METQDTSIRALENRAAASGDPLDRARAERARARAVEAPKPVRRSHVRTWSGARSALVTDMTNAGKRGKTCRQLHVAEPWRHYSSGQTLPQGWGDWLDLFSRLEALEKGTGEESYEDIALLVRAACAGCPEIKHDEREVRGVDAPRPLLTAGLEGVWSGSADEGGIHLRDLVDRNNEPTAITHDQTNARAYELARKVWDGVKLARTMGEASDILSAAGCRLHYFCAVD